MYSNVLVPYYNGHMNVRDVETNIVPLEDVLETFSAHLVETLVRLNARVWVNTRNSLLLRNKILYL